MRDDAEESLGLPTRELPLMITDRAFAGDGSLHYPALDPTLLRILNASNARHYELEAVTDDGRRLDLVQIGADQGLLNTPVKHQFLPIAPAERYDVIIDFARVPVGGRVRIINRLSDGRTRRCAGHPRGTQGHRREPHPPDSRDRSAGVAPVGGCPGA